MMETITQVLFDVAKREREVFIQENGREPTEAEASRMVEMIIRQAKIAQVMLR